LNHNCQKQHITERTNTSTIIASSIEAEEDEQRSSSSGVVRDTFAQSGQLLRKRKKLLDQLQLQA